MFSNPLVLLALFILVVLGGIVLVSNRRENIRRQQRMQKRDYDTAQNPPTPRVYDPLDGTPLGLDNIDVVVKTSKGEAKMRVSRHNAKTLNVHGLTAFPYCRQHFSRPSTDDRRYYMGVGDAAIDLIDCILFYDFFFVDDCVIFDDEGGEVIWDDNVTDELPGEEKVVDTTPEPESELSVVPEPTPESTPAPEPVEDTTRGGSFGYGGGDDGGGSYDSGGGDSGGDCGGD